MEVIGETDSSLAEGVFPSDGVINLALLRFKSDEAAQGTRRDDPRVGHRHRKVTQVSHRSLPFSAGLTADCSIRNRYCQPSTGGIENDRLYAATT
jgi:hypothetical protein